MAAVRQTMGMDCAQQLSTGIYRFITSYDHARFPVIDVERQVVFGHWVFRRRGDVPGVTYKGKFYPFMDCSTTRMSTKPEQAGTGNERAARRALRVGDVRSGSCHIDG